jgi:hypothetical protein
MDEPVIETILTPTRSAAVPVGWGGRCGPGARVVGQGRSCPTHVSIPIAPFSEAALSPWATGVQPTGGVRISWPVHRVAWVGTARSASTRRTRKFHATRSFLAGWRSPTIHNAFTPDRLSSLRAGAPGSSLPVRADKCRRSGSCVKRIAVAHTAHHPMRAIRHVARTVRP